VLRSTKISLIIVSVFGGIAVIAGILRPQEKELRYCGHLKDDESLLSQLKLVRSSHHCISGRAVMDLVQLYVAQQLYFSDENSFASSLSQLTNHFQIRRSDYSITLSGDGKVWCARVPKTGNLAGHYLMTSDGVLQFNSERPAEVGDAVLRRLGGSNSPGH
jgi:hypothetical protein